MKELSRALARIAEHDVSGKRCGGFRHLGSRSVACGSEHAYQLPLGYSAADVERRIGTLIAAVGAPVELIDRSGAVVIRVVEKDLPKQLPVKQKDIIDDKILIGYNRLQQPIYHPLNTHVLIGGASNAGKTDGIRFWVWQLIQQGYEVRICDLKGFSFFPFEPLPGVHIAKTLAESRDMLVESLIELNERKERVIRARDRSIIKEFKPIVCVIDEAASLAPRQNQGRAKTMAITCDEAISMFGQQAREPRMFMLYSTQRPSVDVINLQFRSNTEAAIAFRCRDRENSKLIIGKEGAEQISPNTPGRCIYTYDRDYTLQVPFVGSDDKWDKLLAPLKQEVIDGGNSRRSESPRKYIDGIIQSTSGDSGTDRTPERQFEPIQKGVVATQPAPTRGVSRVRLPQAQKALEAYQKRPAAAGDYTDEVEL